MGNQGRRLMDAELRELGTKMTAIKADSARFLRTISVVSLP